MGKPYCAGGGVMDEDESKVTIEIPTSFDARRVGTAYLRLRVALAHAMLCPTESMRRGTALTATIAYMQDAYPELIPGDELAALQRQRDEMMHADTVPHLREAGYGQPPVSIGEATVRCAAIACVSFLRADKMTAVKARNEVATILRSTGRTDGAERVRRWELEWLPGQHIDSGHDLTDADPAKTVEALQDAVSKSHNSLQSRVMTARDFLRETVQRYAPKT